MKKRILSLLAALTATFLLSSCSVDGNPLPEGMEEAAVLDAGRAVVVDLNEGDWQAVYDQLREDAKTATGSPAAIEAHMQVTLDKVGTYVSEEEAMATGQKLDSGEQYATAVFYCKHEKNQAMYRIAFSAEMELLGLQVAKR